MNREIKFRAWERVKKWIKGIGYTDEWIWRMNYDPVIDGDEVFGGGAVAHLNNGLIETEFFHPMQSTGLHDRNGKEIWEGDIVMAIGNRIFKVEYDNDVAGFYPFFINEYGERSTEVEVIGNIYEHRELLESEGNYE